MSDSFDPYHSWLGIPPRDQPPHFYRLLGLEVFEENANAIENAADRQMMLLRTFQNGPHGNLSQELLNKVSEARLTLLTEEKKAAYDQELAASLGPQAETPTAPPPPPPPLANDSSAQDTPSPADSTDQATPEEEFNYDFDLGPSATAATETFTPPATSRTTSHTRTASVAARGKKKKSSRSPQLILLAFGGLFLTIVCVALFLRLNKGDSPDRQTRSTPPPPRRTNIADFGKSPPTRKPTPPGNKKNNPGNKPSNPKPPKKETPLFVLPETPPLTGLQRVNAGIVPETAESSEDVRAVHLLGNQCDDAVMQYVGKLENLESLTLENTAVTNVGVASLKNLTKLKTLNMLGSRGGRSLVSDTGMEHIAGLSQLESLNIDSSEVSNLGLSFVSGLTNLRSLSFTRTRISDEGVAHLKGLSQLEDLNISHCPVSGAALAALSGMTNLTSLYADNTRVDDQGLGHIRTLPMIQSLSLDRCNITNKGLVHLTGFARLRFLSLNGTEVDDNGLKTLKQLRQLRRLHLGGTHITDNGVEDLIEMRLRYLMLTGTRVTEAGLTRLRQKSPPRAEIFGN